MMIYYSQILLHQVHGYVHAMTRKQSWVAVPQKLSILLFHILLLSWALWVDWAEFSLPPVMPLSPPLQYWGYKCSSLCLALKAPNNSFLHPNYAFVNEETQRSGPFLG